MDNLTKIGTILNTRNGIPSLLEEIQDLNLEFLDLFLPISQEPLSRQTLQELHTYTDIPITYHYTTSTILGSPQTYTFIKDQLLFYIDQADYYHVPTLVIHPPSTRRITPSPTVHFSDEAWFHYYLDTIITPHYQESIAYLTHLLEDIEAARPHRSVTIAIENTDHNPHHLNERLETMATLADILSSYNTKKLGICYDSYKAFTNQEEQDLTAFQELIAHVQLSDYSRYQDEGHLGLGNGDLPLQSILYQCQEINYSGYFSLEVAKSDFKNSKSLVHKYLNQEAK